MVNILNDIGRQKLMEEALVAANQIIVAQAEQIAAQAEQIVAQAEQIAAQAEQIAAQAEQIAALTQSVALLTTKIEELQAKNTKLKTNSRNSSKPPSSDGYGKQAVKNQRVKSGLKPGGQPGREGVTRTYKEKPEKIVELKPIQETCDECGGTIIVEDKACSVRQVIEADKPQTIVIEYQLHRGICESCGKVFSPEPPALAKGAMSIGRTLKAYVIYMTQYQLLPLNRTAQLIEDVYGVRLSEGTLVNIQNEYRQRLAPFAVRAKELLIKSPVAHFDETGMRVMGQLWWMHVASTDTLTLYEIATKRGHEGIDVMGILPRFIGIAVHDHWKSYYRYTNCAHAECNAHILRNLIFLYEDCGFAWAGLMCGLLLNSTFAHRQPKPIHDKCGQTVKKLFNSNFKHVFRQMQVVVKTLF